MGVTRPIAPSSSRDYSPGSELCCELTNSGHEGKSNRKVLRVAALDSQPELKATVLVVEDDEAIRKGVCDRLIAEGLEAIPAADGHAALAAVTRLAPDLVVLDLGLPSLSGFEVLRRLQATGGPPVILLSGLGSESDRVLGLEMGADDYVTKPFSSRELAVRARNLLRRTMFRENPAEVGDHYNCSIDGVQLDVDFPRRCVMLDGGEIALTPREFDLLACFVRHPRQVLSKPQLLELVWEAQEGWVGEATVTEHVRRLRLKLQTERSKANCIDTLWGVGYRFEPDPS